MNHVPLVSDPPPFPSASEPSTPIPLAPPSTPVAPAPPPPPFNPPLFTPSSPPQSTAPPSPPTFASGPASSAGSSPPTASATGLPYSPTPQNWGPAPPMGGMEGSGKPFGGPPGDNPYSAPQSFGGAPSSPADQSGLASSLGVLSIVGGSLSLVLGFCCCPVIALGSFAALGMGVWGWMLASKQLSAVRQAPHLRSLEPPARTAQVLCIIGVVISGLASLITGGVTLLMILSAIMG